jgi:hypothetical protein
MFIKITYPCGIKNAPDQLFTIQSLIVMVISFIILSFNDQVNSCRERIFSLSSTNMTANANFLKCNIAYEECRCSIISNKSHTTTECITDIQVMIAPISPLVSYVLQLYVIYKVFSFTGRYSHIFRDICWIIALFLFIIIAIGVMGSTCLFYNTTSALFLSGFSLFAITFSIFVYKDTKYRADVAAEARQKQRLVENNHKCNISTIVIVV